MPSLLPLLLGLLAWAADPHPNSLSRTSVVVRPHEIRLEVRFQALTWMETMPVDADLDGELDEAELERGRELFGPYLEKSYRLLPPDAAPGAESLPARFLGLDFIEGSESLPTGYRWLEAELVFGLEAPLEALRFESYLFLDSNPEHKDFVHVNWEGEPAVEVLLGDGRQAHEFQSAGERRPGVFFAFLRLGIDHILSGYDHILFLVALFVAARRMRSILWIVTAFTVSHSVTLGLAATGVVQVPGRFVELAIALSIAYVACDNLLHRKPHDPWLEAFGFGLLHGLGFAGFLADALAGEPLLVMALAGFNIGVELGQLAIVLALVGLVRLFLRDRTPDEGLVPLRLRLGSSAVVAVFGFYWFLERAGWI